jgi:starch phosphorylase
MQETTHEDDKQNELLWAVLASYIPSDKSSIQRHFVQHAEFSLAQTRHTIQSQPVSSFQALALSLRDRLIERWKDTDIFFSQQGVKRVNYLSLEFLLGRTLTNAMSNLNLTENYARALSELGIKMEELHDAEHDAGLGNGGLGRLAACFLDSMATMNYPGWGYGLRYTYGMFEQHIKNGYQVELPDYWLINGNPWEIERHDVQYPVRFYGSVEEQALRLTAAEEASAAPQDRVKVSHVGGDVVLAVAYDVPIPGYSTFNTLNLRLWASKPSHEFDLSQFNQGDYFKAIEAKQRSETICSVLYPNDNTYTGKELRLKQQYFFVSASLQDILARFKSSNRPLNEFPDAMAIQLNDTHPTLGIAELMRLLVDVEGLKWAHAWDITTRTFAYTNHTVMPEALEKWQVSLMSTLLPRLMKIIFDINAQFLAMVEKTWPGDIGKLTKLSIIEEQPERKVRMAHLAIVGSHKINGVAAIHSELLKSDVFPEFYQLWPEKFENVTNGVTPRRWLAQANPDLASLISETLKTETWKTNLSVLTGLKKYADRVDFQRAWMKIKRKNKKRLAKWVKTHLNIDISPDALFDVQIKRFHEYKRQLLNMLGVLHRYKQLKGMTDDDRADVVPRVVMFGGKAAPGYHMAKMIIKLITSWAEEINNDPDTHNLLKVVFLPNYNVSLAEMVIPASDLSQHISTAGTEASGTSNMKFSMNGCMIIGTLDGANIEILEEVGEDNMFIFGAETPDVPSLRGAIHQGTASIDERFHQVIEMLKGFPGSFPQVNDVINSVTNGHDHYLVSTDFGAYLDAQDRVDSAFRDTSRWAKMSILNVAGIGKFSSDRSIRDYAENIWGIKPLPRPGPVTIEVDRLAASGLVPYGVQNAQMLSTSPSDVALERLSPIHSQTMRSFSPKV